MPCKFEWTPTGGKITCSRTSQRRCVTCGRPSTKLCDYPIIRNEGEATCDNPCCDTCSVRVGPNRDHCLKHGSGTDSAHKGKAP